MEDELLNQIKSNIDFVRKNVKKSELKWIELDELERATQKVTEYSNQCHKCELIFQKSLLAYSEELKQNVNEIEFGTKKYKKSYYEKFNPVVSHLVDDHNCDIKRTHLLGLGGIAFLVDIVLYILSYFGIINWNIPFVTIMGLGIGAIKDYKVKKEGRALYK